MKISELRDVLYTMQYGEGDVEIYAFVTRESGYLIDCHNETHKNPAVKTGKGYTIVHENPCDSEMRVQELDGFPV